MKTKSREIDWPVWIILGLALFLRLVNTIYIGDDYYANFLSDASTYRLWASKIVSGSSYGGPAFPMGPLYPYFLALCIKIGFSFYSVLFLQALLGTVVVFNILLITRRIFDNKAGVIAGFMAAIYGPFIFYDGLLLSESLQLFLISSSLVFIIPVKKKKIRMINYFVSGILIGLAGLGRGTILLFPLFAALYWLYKYLQGRQKKPGRYIRQAVLILVGAICGILPATLHNVSNSDFVPISSNFGINFYIGNNPDATGAYNEPPGLNLSSDFTGRQIAEKETGQKLKSSGVSRFWFERASDYISKNSVRFIGGLLGKAWLYFWQFDIPQAESIQIHEEFSPVFHFLPKGYWFVLIPGLFGIFMTKKGESRLLLILLFLSSLAGCMVFFVIGRFKLAGSISLLIFAGAGIHLAYKSIKDKNRANLVNIAIITTFSLFLLFLPRSIDRKAKIASAYDNVGISYFFKRNPGEAIKWYRRAVRLDPSHSGALNNIGGYFYTMQQPDSAIYYFHKSINSDSSDDKAYQNLGRTFVNLGMADSAGYYFKKAQSLSPYGLDAEKALMELDMANSDTASSAGDLESFDRVLQRAENYAAGRQFGLAEEYYRRALRLRPDNIKALNNLGFVYQAQGKLDEAIKMFSEVIGLSGENAVAYNNLASIFYRKGQLDSAEVLWERASALDPNNQQIQKNLDFLRKNRNK